MPFWKNTWDTLTSSVSNAENKKTRQKQTKYIAQFKAERMAFRLFFYKIRACILNECSV